MRALNFRHLFGAARYSLQGLGHAFRHEQAFRHEALVLIVLAAILIITRPGLGLSLLVVGAWVGVMIVELLNSALECALDLITKEHNPLVGRAKDMASAGVFLGVVLNVLLWAYLIFC